MENHSVILDILSEDADGALVNIEMQSYHGGNNPQRVRYYQANMEGIYYVECILKDTGYSADNGVHEIYANLESECENEAINELLANMKNSDSSYQTVLFPNVASS